MKSAGQAEASGMVHDLSLVLMRARPVSALRDTLADHTSPGDRNTVKSSTSSELAAPRKRTFTALPLTPSVLVMLNSVPLLPAVE